MELTTQETNTAALTAWVRLLRAHSAITRTFNAQLQAQHGLTINDYEALLVLAHDGGNRLKRIEVSERLQLTPSGITRLLEGLERCGLVAKEPCEADARVTYAVLTEAGRAKLAEASSSHLASVEALFSERYSGEELRTLADLLGRLPGAAEADPGACSL